MSPLFWSAGTAPTTAKIRTAPAVNDGPASHLHPFNITSTPRLEAKHAHNRPKESKGRKPMGQSTLPAIPFTRLHTNPPRMQVVARQTFRFSRCEPPLRPRL